MNPQQKMLPSFEVVEEDFSSPATKEMKPVTASFWIWFQLTLMCWIDQIYILDLHRVKYFPELVKLLGNQSDRAIVLRTVMKKYSPSDYDYLKLSWKLGGKTIVIDHNEGPCSYPRYCFEVFNRRGESLFKRVCDLGGDRSPHVGTQSIEALSKLFKEARKRHKKEPTPTP